VRRADLEADHEANLSRRLGDRCHLGRHRSDSTSRCRSVRASGNRILSSDDVLLGDELGYFSVVDEVGFVLGGGFPFG